MIIKIKKVTPEYIVIKLGVTCYLKYLHNIKGRMYDKTFNEHKIPHADWTQFRKDAESDKHTFEGLELVDKLGRIPRVTLEFKHIGLRNFSQDDVYKISPNVAYDYIRRFHTLPKNEAYLLAEKYKDYCTVEVLKLVESQAAARVKLSQLEENVYSAEYFNGFKLREWQSQDIAKIDVLGGRVLLSHPVGKGKSLMSLKYAHDKGLRTLIACPGNAKMNWEREILKFIPDAKIRTLNGRIPQNHEIDYVLDKNIRFVIINYEVLCSSIKDEHDNETFLWADLLKIAGFDLFIPDEAHKLGNSDAKRSKASMKLRKIAHVLPLSASPFVNNVGELFPIMHIIDGDVYDNQAGFDAQFAGRSRSTLDHLHDVLKTTMIRRRNADIEKDLEPVNKITEYYELSKKARELEEKIMDGIYLSLFSKEFRWEDGRAISNILEQFLRLKQVCAFDKVDFTSDLATKVYDSLCEEGKGKCLIYTQFTPAIDAIAARLGDEARIIDGRIPPGPRRMAIVDEFQKPDSKIHFIVGNPKAMGESLNITAAHNIIFNDLLWNPLGHEQATGRAYGRLGDMHTVDEYWVIASGTIEEKILTLLWKKQVDFDQVIEGLNPEVGGSVFMNLLKEMAMNRVIKQEKL